MLFENKVVRTFWLCIKMFLPEQLFSHTLVGDHIFVLSTELVEKCIGVSNTVLFISDSAKSWNAVYLPQVPARHLIQKSILIKNETGVLGDTRIGDITKYVDIHKLHFDELIGVGLIVYQH